jgi:hypothetical protein
MVGAQRQLIFCGDRDVASSKGRDAHSYRRSDGEMASPLEKSQRYKYVSRMVERRGKAVERAERASF